DHTFDVAISAFVLFHLPDPTVGLTELRRILRPGGAAGTTVWGDEPTFPALEIWTEELDAHGAPKVAPLRHDLLGDEASMTAALEQAGYDDIHCWAVRHHIEADAELFITHMSSLGGRRRL